MSDNAGNSESADPKTFNVNKTQASVTLELESVTEASVTRWIKFVIGGTGGSVPPVTIIEQVTFTGGTGSVTLTDLSNDGAWTRISAKDEQHTLRRGIDLVDNGNGQFSADFTGANNLRGGDLTNDNLVDIRDFGVYVGQFGTSPDLFGSWPDRNANISCDGYVDTNDFSYIQIRFLATGDDEVGGTSVASSSIPMTSISLRLLARCAGFESAWKSDVNRDRVIDTADGGLFIRRYLGVRRGR